MTAAPDPRWEAFATREPFFAVLPAPKYRRANLTPDHERQFWDTGDHLPRSLPKPLILRYHRSRMQ